MSSRYLQISRNSSMVMPLNGGGPRPSILNLYVILFNFIDLIERQSFTARMLAEYLLRLECLVHDTSRWTTMLVFE